jgi:sister chromatid cohesion protein DCC1
VKRCEISLILFILGCLYPISSNYLSKILELLLNTLVSLSLRPQDAPAEELALELEQEHEIKREVTTQVMSWFGLLDGDSWKMDVPIVLAQIGLGILGAYEVRFRARAYHF